MTQSEIQVLLVDDDPKLLRGLSRHLSDAGFNVVTAVSAAEATVVLDQYEIDVVICDNKMPGTTGKRFLANIRREHPKVARFMLSGDVSKQDEFLLQKEIGICGLFHKPCEPAKIIEAILETQETTA